MSESSTISGLWVSAICDWEQYQAAEASFPDNMRISM